MNLVQLQLRKAQLDDLDCIGRLFDEARQYMAAQGNTVQWVDGRPNAETVRPDVEKGLGTVVVVPAAENTPEKIVGFFVLSDNEPAYEQIHGLWAFQEPYVVLHRFAATPNYKVGNFVLSYLQQHYTYIRLDTHRKNLTMKHLMSKFNFRYVGDVDYNYAPHDGIRICFEWHK